MDLAVSFLWKGYVLLNLGQYKEAYNYLLRVVPIFQNVTKAGGQIWHPVEYALTKALVPLCEFKLNPSKDVLKKAQKGIEDYIKSLSDNKFKLDGYVYYFHLKKQFANVYTANPKTFIAPVSAQKNPEVLKSSPLSFPLIKRILKALSSTTILIKPKRWKSLGGMRISSGSPNT